MAHEFKIFLILNLLCSSIPHTHLWESRTTYENSDAELRLVYAVWSIFFG